MSSASQWPVNIDSPALRTIGHGSSRRIAEQVAAEQALKELLA
jgi:ribonuclease-3